MRQPTGWRAFYCPGRKNYDKRASGLEHTEDLGKREWQVWPEIESLNAEHFVELAIGERESGHVSLAQRDQSRLDSPGIATTGGTDHLLREINASNMPTSNVSRDEFNGPACPETNL